MKITAPDCSKFRLSSERGSNCSVIRFYRKKALDNLPRNRLLVLAVLVVERLDVGFPHFLFSQGSEIIDTKLKMKSSSENNKNN